MHYSIQSLRCSSCGAPIEINQVKCEFCGSRLHITSFRSIPFFTDDMLREQISNNTKNSKDILDLFSRALCLLKLHVFKQAEDIYRSIITQNIENDECFFLLSVALLEGRKPFLHKKNEVDEMTRCIENAILLKPSGIYYLFYSYLIQDYYEKKGMRYKEKSDYYKTKSLELGVSEGDRKILFIDWEEW